MGMKRSPKLKNLTQAFFATLTILILVQTTTQAAISRNNRAYGAGKYGLELDGAFVGWIDSVEGGDAVGEVDQDKATGKKHIGNVKYNDISFQMGAEMSPAFWDWITAALNNKHVRKNGAIIFADYDYKEKSRREFTDGLISEVQFPAMKANSDDGALMGLKFSIASSKRIDGSGKPYNRSKVKYGQEMIFGFSLKMDGLQEASANMAFIRRSVIKTSTTNNGNISYGDKFQEPGKIDFPNLEVELPELAADEVYAWHEDFVINGAGITQKGKTGTLVYLNKNRQKMFSLDFSNLGIISASTIKVEGGDLNFQDNAKLENTPRVKIEMYCEDIRFNYSPATRFY